MCKSSDRSTLASASGVASAASGITRKKRVPLRPVSGRSDGTAEAGGPHHADGLIGLSWDHRLVGGVRLQGTAGSAVRLHQNVVELLRQHRHGRLWGRQLTRSRYVCPGTQQLMRPAQFVQLRRCPGAGQVRKRENLGGGAQQDRMLSGQLLAQGPQESGLSPAADDGSDTGTDIQQLRQGSWRILSSIVLLFIE